MVTCRCETVELDLGTPANVDFRPLIRGRRLRIVMTVTSDHDVTDVTEVCAQVRTAAGGDLVLEFTPDLGNIGDGVIVLEASADDMDVEPGDYVWEWYFVDGAEVADLTPMRGAFPVVEAIAQATGS